MASGKGSSDARSTTTNTAVNQQVGASEGSVAAGAGASIVIQNLDAALAEASLREIGAVAGKGFDVVGDTAETSILSAERTAGSATKTALDFAAGEQERNRQREQNLLNFARQQGELVAAGAGVTPPAQVGELSRQMVYLVLGLGVLFVFVNRRNKS